jgi:hypothetical protein
MDLVEKYLGEVKKKNIIIIKRDEMDVKKSIRIPTAPGSQYFKNKKKYNRKKKHKNEENM